MKKFSVLSLLLGIAFLFAAMSCQPKESPLKSKVEEYATVELTSDLAKNLTPVEKDVVNIFFKAAQIADDLFWKQTFGDKSAIDNLTDPYAKQFAYIQYGAWDRLDNNRPFLEGYGPKPDACNYYPVDITKEEFDALENPDKNSLYTVLRRDENDNLFTRWYHEEYAVEVEEMCNLLQQAADLTENEGLKNYLLKRIEAFRTDDYLESDLAWMEMKDSRVDFVIGPIENYDDMFREGKTSYEAFILLKDEERSKDLAKFIKMLPDLQNQLPCDPKYKTFVPGTESDLNVYDAVYYAGDCNAGSKTIAINLPNDERVHEMKGARRLQLRNAMKFKFDNIMMPIGEVVLDPAFIDHLKFDAFFWNVTFHEVGHGLGVKQTIDGKGTVDDAMGTEKTSWEEGKADILGLFMVCKLIEQGEITNITIEDAITTYIAGIFRSVRFGAASSHGKANMMCFNYFAQNGAFTRSAEGKYSIDYDKAKETIDSWANIILTTQGDGNYEFAKSFREKNGSIGKELQADLDRINEAGIPVDIRFIQGPQVLFK